MSLRLDFEKIVLYESGEPGISVKVQVRMGDTSLSFKAKLDTGATFCVFERQIVETLVIDIESGKPLTISTPTGTFRAFGHDVTLIVEGYEFDSEVYFNEGDGFRRNLLGRNGFLNRIIVGINDYDGELYLRRYDE